MNQQRRNFLTQMFTVAVLTANFPHKLLGKITPILRKDDDLILGRYYVSLNDYPVLRELWGSVRIEIPPTMTYGPFAPIIVTRIDEWDYGIEYSCIYTLCPHQGQLVYDFEPEFRQFKCSGHGTIFDADGTYMAGPAAQDLTTYKVHRQDEDILYMDIPAVKTDVIDSQIHLAYIKSANPNPCFDRVSFEYGIEFDSFITLKISDINGNEKKLILNEFRQAGHYTIEFDINSLNSGVYFLILELDKISTVVRKFTVAR